MNNVFFRPWIGNKYGRNGSVFNKKILVLGDSHYTDELEVTELLTENEQSCDFTSGVINDYLDEGIKGSWKSTFTKFMNSFVKGTPHEELSRDALWNSVSFYNYLQIPAGSTARLTQHFNYSEEKDRNAFLEVIEELEPDIIISWGNKVWDAIPENFGYGNCAVNEEFGDFFYTYPFKIKDIKLIGITHPSTSYKSSFWANVFSKTNVNT